MFVIKNWAQSVAWIEGQNYFVYVYFVCFLFSDPYERIRSTVGNQGLFRPDPWPLLYNMEAMKSLLNICLTSENP